MGDINDLIATGIKPPDPTSVFGRLQAIQSQRQQQQIGALELQEKQRALAQTQAVNDAYRSALTVNPDGTPEIDTGKLSGALATGGHGSTIPTILKGIQDYKKSSADLSEAQGKVAVLEQDAGGSLGATVKSANNDPNLFLTLAQHAVAAKHVDAQTVGPLIQQVQAAMQQDPTGNAARTLVGQISDHLVAGSPAQQKLANEAKSAQGAADSGTARLKDAALNEAAAPGKLALTSADAAAKAAELEKTQTQNAAQQLSMAAEAEKTQPGTLARVMGGLQPAMQAKFANAKTPADFLRIGQTPAESVTSDQAAQREADAEKDRKITQGFEGQRVALSQKEYQQKYGDVLGQMSPNNRAIAEKVASGEFDPAQLGRMPGKEAILAGAMAINPAWTPQIYAAKKSFTDPGQIQAKNLGTISRIVGHIGQFEQNSQNMGFAPAYAMGVSRTGDQNKLNEDAHAISGELEKLVSGGVGSAGQTRQWMDSLHSPSAEARQKAVDEISQLVGSQYESMNQTYKSAVGTDLPISKYVTPAGQAWMKSKNINVGGNAPAAAGPAQPAQAPQGAAPPVPAKLTSADVGKTFISAKTGKPIKITAVNPKDGTQFQSVPVTP